MLKRESFKPAVANNILLLIAGCVWIFVGTVLLYLSFSWLRVAPNSNIYLFAGSGIVLALLVHHFSFLKIAEKNIKRILLTDEKKCIFAFISWKSYLLIALMITIGSLLRRSKLPKQHLSIIYTGIGLALILSSIRYIKVFIKETRKKNE